jgi:hypothetical protein
MKKTIHPLLPLLTTIFSITLDSKADCLYSLLSDIHTYIHLCILVIHIYDFFVYIFCIYFHTSLCTIFCTFFCIFFYFFLFFLHLLYTDSCIFHCSFYFIHVYFFIYCNSFGFHKSQRIFAE